MKTLTFPGGSARIVQWKDKSGTVVASSRPAPAAVSKPKPAGPSADALMAVARQLAYEAAATADPSLRARLYDAAGRTQIKSYAARRREVENRKPVDPAQLDAWVAEAITRLGA